MQKVSVKPPTAKGSGNVPGATQSKSTRGAGDQMAARGFAGSAGHGARSPQQKSKTSAT